MKKTFDFAKTPVVDAVNEILLDAVDAGASDIHFDPHEDNLKVRIRVDGILEPYTFIPNEFSKTGLLSGLF